MSAGFTHLHCHTEYSVLDGACKIGEILQKCRDYDMKSCAITDHGVLFGAIDFYQAAKAAGVKPIIGCELYVAKAGRRDRTKRGSENYHHFLTLCENDTGYFNLCKLSSLGFLEGFYYKPRVDDELLAKYSEGLIATTSCLAGEVPQQILNGDLDAANDAIKKYVEIFGKDNFLVELMDHGMKEQRRVNPILAEMAEHHGLTLIATNDVHYVNKEDAEPHDALLCIQTNAMVDDEDRFRFSTDEVYFRSPDEMREVFSEWPEAVSNTEVIAERCNVELKLDQHLIPEFVPPEGHAKDAYLEELVCAGLKDRYGGPTPAKYIERADYELRVIREMEFTDYFLVVWDLIDYARREGIPVGPGRGSGAGSIVAYALKITNIDPIRYGLLFERFLNQDRVSMPDFDIDFCYVRREEMIEYARRKYGEENVSQIITFGRMLAKQAVRNVGRVLGMPYADADRLAKLIPDELKITLEEAYSKTPELRALVDNDPAVGRLWRLARRLEGTIGNCGTHAAGVVICDKPIMDYVPLYQAAGTDTVSTQVEFKYVEAVGLLKMDFLGLRTLTVIHDTVRLIKEAHGIEIDIDAIEPDDEKAYEVMRSGKTTGIFQLESSGMRDLAKRIGLENLEEIAALVALFRPGPMQFINDYIKHKLDPSTIIYDHELLEPILRDTYGIIVYQEQVMQLAQALAGFTLGQADVLRWAMGKKKIDLMAEQRSRFVQGCKDTNGIDKGLATKLFDKIETFAFYGFNKSHSIAYAFVAYQTAYLKAHYPAEFMAALLTSESGNLDRVAKYVDECRRMGVQVLPPDINTSRLQFAVEDGKICFGLAAIKNVGEAPATAIAQERLDNGPYEDIYDFCARLDSRSVSRRLVESLNRAGAFASTNWARAQVEATLDAAFSEAQVAQRERESGQTSLFDLLDADEAANLVRSKPDIEEWPEHELLQFEKDMLGLYVSSHPLEKYTKLLKHFSMRDATNLRTLEESQAVVLGGLLTEVKHHMTAKGKRMAFVTIETLAGPVEVTVFSDVFERHGDLLVKDKVVVVPSHINYRNNEPGLIADDIVPIDQAEAKLTKAVHIRMSTLGLESDLVSQLAAILGAYPGPCDVYLHCTTPDHREITIHATSACTVKPSPKLVTKVEELIGEDCLWFSAGSELPHHNEGPVAPRPLTPKERAIAARKNLKTA